MNQLFVLLLVQPLSAVCLQFQQLQQHMAQIQVLRTVSTSALFAERRHVLLSSLAYSTSLAANPASTIAAIVPKSAKTTVQPIVQTPPFTEDLSWPLGKVAFSLLPLAGTSTRRATVQQEIVPDAIWTFDQLQGIVNVNVPVRQTVIRLSPAAGGGLWVHNPVAPTPQLLTMMRNLESRFGPIRHIVLGTVALEHKATFGAFAQRFPNATVWIQPGQWSFPIDLPIELEGVTQRGPKLRELPLPGRPVSSSVYEYYSRKDPTPEWAADFDWEVLGPFSFQSVGGFSETAFFHKSTRSLIVTDTVVSVTETPPAILMEDPRALLYHARDRSDVVIPDTEENRKRGWRRMVQFGLVFFPSQIEVVSVRRAFADASHVDPRMRNLGEGSIPISSSLYPWTWASNDADITNFRAISQNGAPFCPPILTKLILDREPQATIEWVDSVCQRFDFVRVIPGHLNNNLRVRPKEFSAAFDVLRSTPQRPYPQRPLPEDLALLQKASDLLTRLGVVGPSQVCDGELARVRGRFRS